MPSARVKEHRENQQRAVLEKLSIGNLNVFFNKKGSLPDEYLFRGNKVLKVIEPNEPNSIRWNDLDESFFVRTNTLFFDITIVSQCTNFLSVFFNMI